MGYDLTRFVGEIDQEFLCQICKLVLDNPVQIPCDHTFCYDCIKIRITSERSCPVDHIPITLNGETSVFKQPCTAFRNLLYKLNIKCDYQSVGCTEIVKLENLGEHVKCCEYNSNAEVVCDKGCNLAITRREYLSTSCYTHLKQENRKLSHRLSFQRKRFEGLANCLYDRIKKLNDELGLQRVQAQQLENVVRRQHQEIAEMSSHQRSPNVQLKWRLCHNMKIDESNNLEIDDISSSPFAFAQSYHPLQPARPFFRIKLAKSPSTQNSSVSIQRHLIWIGLTRKGHPIVRNPEAGSIACIWNGTIQVDKECVAVGQRWGVEDCIKLGIKFPKSFMTEESNNNAVVCVHKNDKMCFEKHMQMPFDGFFPTICIYGSDTKVTYFFN